MMQTDVNARYEVFRSQRRFGSLDALRALSIIAVLWHHSGGPAPWALLDRGQMGVHLFFAISGFLITTLLLREWSESGSFSLRDFYIRRALRIFPLYYAVLLAYCVIVFAMERDSADGKEFFQNLPYFLSYTSNIFVDLEAGERVIFFFSWSLATEEQFYLVFPWLLWFLKPRWTPVALAAIGALVFANHSGHLQNWITIDSLAYKILWEIAPCIVMGAISALIVNSKSGYRFVAPVLAQRYSSLAALAFALIMLSIPKSNMQQEYLVYLSLTALVLACSLREDHALARLMRWAPLVRLGMISYGVYLLHMLCFNASDRLWPGGAETQWVGRLTIGFGMVFIAAEISFRTFEAWFLSQKSRFTSAVSGPPAA